MQTVLLILCIVICIIAIVQTVLIFRLLNSRQNQSADDIQKEIARLETSLNATQQTSGQAFEKMAGLLRDEQKNAFDVQNERLSRLEQQTVQYLSDSRQATEERMRSFSEDNARQLMQIETTVEKHLTQIHAVIDEKMQETLDKKLGLGFQAQADKLTQIERQTAQHLIDAKEASETLTRQNEERMRSFSEDNERRLTKIESTVQTNLEQIRSVIDEKMQETLDKRLGLGFQAQTEKLAQIEQQTSEHLEAARKASESLTTQNEERMRSFSEDNERRLTRIENTVQKNLTDMRTDQNEQLNQMRTIVDEKMQTVLRERMNQAFSAVNERLEQVHKGLGEMQTLAGSVGDLKKMLSNVKTRGEIGEIQLEALLSDILSESQYRKNVSFGRKTVEFAVVLPTEQGGEMLLPLDSKFPGDTYMHLQDAYESGDDDDIKAAQKALADRIRGEAKDIADKYINPPDTTDFGVLFLPTEGLYSEAVRAGLLDDIFQKYRVFVTGPSTLSAMLSTLRIGFKSIAVQKRSNEVWQVLGEVKTEFGKFAAALELTQKNLATASKNLDALVGTRTKAMNRKLENVQNLENIQNYLTENPSDDN